MIVVYAWIGLTYFALGSFLLAVMYRGNERLLFNALKQTERERDQAEAYATRLQDAVDLIRKECEKRGSEWQVRNGIPVVSWPDE